ncbi:hypothetical protein D3C85_1347460 [compost metagenome]
MRSAAKSPQAQTQITLSGAIEGEITITAKQFSVNSEAATVARLAIWHKHAPYAVERNAPFRKFAVIRGDSQ